MSNNTDGGGDRRLRLDPLGGSYYTTILGVYPCNGCGAVNIPTLFRIQLNDGTYLGSCVYCATCGQRHIEQTLQTVKFRKCKMHCMTCGKEYFAYASMSGGRCRECAECAEYKAAAAAALRESEEREEKRRRAVRGIADAIKDSLAVISKKEVFAAVMKELVRNEMAFGLLNSVDV